MSSDGDTGPHDLEALARAAFRLSAALQRERDRLARAEGLTSARWQALGELADAGGEALTTQLAARLDITRQGASRLLHELADDAMITLRRCPVDRRAHIAAITALGRARLAGVRARQHTWLPEVGLAGQVAGVVAASRAVAAGRGAAPDEAPRWQPGVAAPSGTSAPKRTFEIVSQNLLNAIREGLLTTGSKLPPERELAATFKVGRSAVRESLRSLESAGVLRFERGPAGGAFVRESGPDGIVTSVRAMLILGRLPITDLLEVRAMLIGHCARLGAMRGTPDIFAQIERNIGDLEAHILNDQDQRASVKPAMDFYRLMARTTQNPLIVLLVDAIADLVSEMLVSTRRWPRLDALSPRRDSLAAMRAGREDEAERILREHFADTNRLLLNISHRSGVDKLFQPSEYKE